MIPDYSNKTDAAERWNINKPNSITRLGKLVARDWLTESKAGKGKASSWNLTPEGTEIIENALGLKN